MTAYFPALVGGWSASELLGTPQTPVLTGEVVAPCSLASGEQACVQLRSAHRLGGRWSLPWALAGARPALAAGSARLCHVRV